MKKALQISLARTLFTVEEDAYARLDAYLAAIRALFAQVEGKDEILADVEGRIAEKFLESKKGIVDIDEVEKVIAAMGEADAYKDGNAGDAAQAAPSASASSQKKFYRDPKGAILGGVCTGIANYLDVDVLWVRIVVILLAFANGFGILAYLVLWLITPEAKTMSQRLEMGGMPVTIETIKENAREATHTTAGFFGRGIRGIFRFVGNVIRVVFSLFCIVGSAIVIAALSVVVPFTMANPGDLFAFPLTDAVPLALLWVAALAAYLLVVIPALLVFLIAVGLLRRKPVLNATASAVMGLLWVVALVTGAATSARVIPAVVDHVRTAPQFAQATRTLPLDDAPIAALVATDGIRVTLVQGPVPSLEVAGRADMVDRARAATQDGTLTIRTERREDRCFFCDHGSLEATLTLPDIDAATAREGSRLTVERWVATKPVEFTADQGSRLLLELTAPEARVTAKQGSRAEVSGAVATLHADAQQGSSIDVSAEGESLTVAAAHGSRIDATVAEYAAVTGTARQGSRVSLDGPETANVRASEGSSVEYVREPKAPTAPEAPVEE